MKKMGTKRNSTQMLDKDPLSTVRPSDDMTPPLFKLVYPYHLLTFTLKPEKTDEVKGADSVMVLLQLYIPCLNLR